ncbi:MAG: site-specific integrase [Pseudomonadota bacterium]
MSSIKISRSTIERLPVPEDGKPAYHFDQLLIGFGLRISPKGVRTYIAQGRVNGRLVRKTIGRHPAVSPEEARQRARELLSNLAAGIAPEDNKPIVRVSDVLDEWLRFHVEAKLKPRTASDYRKITEQTLRPELGRHEICSVERAHIAKIHNDRQATPRRANYVLAVASSFFTFAEDSGHRPIDSNPARRIKPYPENRRERFLASDEVARAAQAISALEISGVLSIFAAAGLRLCLLTGARQGEIVALRWAEVDFERRLLLLEDSKTGRKPIYLSQPAIKVLEALPKVAGNPYVIAGEKPGQPYQNLTRAWMKVRVEAGLEDVRLHDLRHTFASFGAAEALSLPMIGKLLGHRVPATTARYAHLAADPVAEANERIGERLAQLMRGDPTGLRDA